jgi:signal transduction histidine kinase
MGQTCGLTVETEVDPQAEPESEELRVLLFEAARELLFNVVKHAETGCARLSLRVFDGGELRLVVADEGAGFVPAEQKVESDATGFGLFSLRERLELLGGRLHVEAVPGRGTRVSIVAPSRSSSSPGARLPGERAAAATVISAGPSP